MGRIFFARARYFGGAVLFAALFVALTGAAHAQDRRLTAFSASIAAVQGDFAPQIAAFYQARGFAPFWTDDQARARLQALLAALDQAPAHGLPMARYDAAALRGMAQTARSIGDLGRLEAALTAAFLHYAGDMAAGALVPSQVDSGILIEPRRPDPAAILDALARAPDPAAFLRALPPRMPAYTKLMAELAALRSKTAQSPPISAAKLSLGQAGPQVILLRDRLIALGFMPQTALAIYDGTLMRAVQRFQRAQGLNADGLAGPSTIAQLNAAPLARQAAVLAALERLRWQSGAGLHGAGLGARHIWVNLPDFTAKIIDHGAVTFRTRVVIGKNTPDQRSPEFSDMMEYMAVNPSWGVPRSIIVKEYLPLLQANPNAVAHLQVLDRNGRVVPRSNVNFASYTSRSFPYGLRQPPSDGNALGKVKFMFPNAHNIYLHDTPAKNLFDHEERAYSHGCIRVADPVDLAYALLSAQSADPRQEFQTALDSGRETNISLQDQVPVHLVYFTAYPSRFDQVSYRADVYGRDAKLLEALIAAGLEFPAQSG